MQTWKREITKAQYDEYFALKKENKLFTHLQSVLPDEICLGYGFYGASLGTENGKHYLYLEVGSSCD